jgi:hypothetical protein
MPHVSLRPVARRRSGGRSQRCRRAFAGNTMVQHSPDGRPLFLHANLSPKWSLRVPGDFAAYTRRRARCMHALCE